MIPKSIATIESVNAASAPLIFIETNADGSVNFDQTRGVLNVYCNKKRGETTYEDKFEIRVAGKANLTTIANHVDTGKQLDRVTCFMSVEKNGAIKKDPDGNPLKIDGKIVYEDVIRLHMQSVELGNDSEKVEKDAGMANLRAMRAQGTIPPMSDEQLEVIVNGYNTGRRTKSKNKDFDLNEAVRTGKWGKASLWSKDKKHWQPQQQAAQSTEDPMTAAAKLAGVDPEVIKLAMQLKAQQAFGATQTASTSEAASAPTPEPTGEGSVWNNEVPF